MRNSFHCNYWSILKFVWHLPAVDHSAAPCGILLITLGFVVWAQHIKILKCEITYHSCQAIQCTSACSKLLRPECRLGICQVYFCCSLGVAPNCFEQFHIHFWKQWTLQTTNKDLVNVFGYQNPFNLNYLKISTFITNSLRYLVIFSPKKLKYVLWYFGTFLTIEIFKTM